MGKVIAIANQKGGVGKTTTTVNLGACLGEKGKKVLIIDMDPQGNTTSGFGIDKETLFATSYEMVLGDSTAQESIIELPQYKIDLIPASIDLAGAEVELIGIDQRERLLDEKVAKIKNNYDFILIDCPPSLNILTINAFRAADSILVPIQCEFYALEGLTQLISTINLVKQRLNPKIEIEGLVFTMYDNRTNLSLQVVEEVKNFLPSKIYETKIPRNIRLAEAPSYGMPVIYYERTSKGAVSYLELAEEVIQRNQK
ncbi:MAG: ParA family protein [Lachnospiraceae bacterium]|nr:ParA family protein [Lachnospiraceae bacterium]